MPLAEGFPKMLATLPKLTADLTQFGKNVAVQAAKASPDRMYAGTYQGPKLWVWLHDHRPLAD
jgi:hypothetical protein